MKKKEIAICLQGLGQHLSIDRHCLYEEISPKTAWCGDSVVLIKGDLSGIQSYLYNVNRAEDIDGKVAKRLRGRSFYLSAFCHAFAHELGQIGGGNGRAGGKPNDYILSATGGKFLVVLPSSTNLETELKKWKQQIDNWLWRETWGEVFLNLAFVQCSQSDLKENFSTKVALRLQSQLDLGKSQKYQQLFVNTSEIDSHGNLFKYPLFQEKSPQEYGEECHSCRSLPASGKGADPALCEQCNLHQRIGGYQNLPTHNYLELRSRDSTLQPDESLEFHGNYGILWDDPNKGPRVPSFVPPFPYQRLRATSVVASSANDKVRELCAYCSIQKRDPQECGEEGYERLPTRFHCLATLAHLEGGAAKVAVLAIDGDDFSFHFNSTIGMTLVDHVAMGKLIYQFFADYLIDLLKQYDCYLVYSGGDDLVVVGPWMYVYEVADTLYQQFKKATNGVLHFSAGLHVTNPQEPIYESIKYALELLHRAKAHDDKDQHKNAIQLMSTTVPWPKFNGVMALAKELVEAEQLKIISTGFIYGLYTICEQYEHYRDDGDVNGLRYMSWLASHLQRNLRQEWPNDDPDHKAKEEKAKKLRNKLHLLTDPTENNLLPYLRAALDWAALKTRES
jgi:CRISPR-associated protein Csm1